LESCRWKWRGGGSLRRSEFYLDRVPAGRREAVIEDAGGRCRFHLDVAAAQTGIQQLGALGCVREKESRP